MIKGLRKEGRLQEKVKEILRKVGEGEMKIVELRRIRAERKDKREIIIVKLESEEMKRKVMRNK